MFCDNLWAYLSKNPNDIEIMYWFFNSSDWTWQWGWFTYGPYFDAVVNIHKRQHGVVSY